MNVAMHKSIHKVFSLHAEDIEAQCSALETNLCRKREQKRSKNNIG